MSYHTTLRHGIGAKRGTAAIREKQFGWDFFEMLNKCLEILRNSTNETRAL